jgi:hypothetical protein
MVVVASEWPGCQLSGPASRTLPPKRDRLGPSGSGVWRPAARSPGSAEPTARPVIGRWGWFPELPPGGSAAGPRRS